MACMENCVFSFNEDLRWNPDASLFKDISPFLTTLLLFVLIMKLSGYTCDCWTCIELQNQKIVVEIQQLQDTTTLPYSSFGSLFFCRFYFSHFQISLAQRAFSDQAWVIWWHYSIRSNLANAPLCDEILILLYKIIFLYLSISGIRQDLHRWAQGVTGHPGEKEITEKLQNPSCVVLSLSNEAGNIAMNKLILT